MSVAIDKSTHTPTRHFIDWHQLPLPAAAEWISQRHVQGPEQDLANTVMVVPTSRSQRRLQELLMQIAEERKQILVPGEVTTIGSLPELLYVPQRPLAGQLTQILAWVKALRETPVKALRQFTSRVPDLADSTEWQTLANVLAGWHTELSGNGLTFRDVLKTGRKLKYFTEQERWEALDSIQSRYLNVLNDEGLWDQQTARLVAVRKKECHSDKQIYLIGTVDLNPVARQMLEQVADQVTAIVFANQDDHDKFDETGCLNIEAWEQYRIPVDDDQIIVGEQPQDQARLLTRFLQEQDGRYGVDQVSISVPDPRLISSISRSLIECGVATHDTGGASIANTRVFVLLEHLSAWLSDSRFESFAALVRHPDMYQWICQQVGNDQWLPELDQYQNNRLPFYISTDIQDVYFGGKDRKGKDRYANLERAYQSIYELLQPLLPPAGKSLAAWGGPWRQVLVAIYRDTVLDRDNADDRRTIQASQKIIKSLIDIEEQGNLLDGQLNSVDGLMWALTLCGEQFVADPANHNAIPLTGWLDTPLEDTPVTVITSFNEGFIPSSNNASLFLPNSIRTQLGLLDNRRRYARDAYSLAMILASREEVLLIAGRRDEDGQPLMPGRLLMTGSPDQIARRAAQLFSKGQDASGWTFGKPEQRSDQQQFPIPAQVNPEIPIDRLRVTDFKQYLACPYRFYLSRVLGLERISDDQDELNPAQFGSLIHDVVEDFGRSDVRDSRDVQQIETHVLDCLNRFALARYGRRAVPTVQIQLEQARVRLRAFAEWQADHRDEGYEIFEVEREKTHCEFIIDGKPFTVSGQIDRIDINHAEKIIGLYDYKTGDKGEAPRALHQSSDGVWKDLQLPLYHHLLGKFDLPEDYQIQTGLILVTKDIGKVRLHVADWSKAELAEADQIAIEIMRKVRAGEFWPPTDMNLWWDDFGVICQSGVFEHWTQVAEEEDS